MIVNRTTKTFVAILTLVAAILLISGHVVNDDPVQDWGIAGLLLLISVAFWVWLWQSDMADATGLVVADLDETPSVPRTQEWVISQELIDTLESRVRSDQDRHVTIHRQSTVTEDEEPRDVPGAGVPVFEEPFGDETTVEDIEAMEPEVVEREGEAEAVSEGEAETRQPGVADEIAEAAPEEAEVVKEAREGELVAEKAVSDASAAPDVTTEPDDLTRIEGIGAKYREALLQAGIRTFQDLTEMTEEQLAEAVRKSGMRRSAAMATWAEQARLADEGDWEGLYELQSKLRGGRSG